MSLKDKLVLYKDNLTKGDVLYNMLLGTSAIAGVLSPIIFGWSIYTFGFAIAAGIITGVLLHIWDL